MPFRVLPRVVTVAATAATQEAYSTSLSRLLASTNPLRAHVVLVVNPRFAKATAAAGVRLGVPVLDAVTPSEGLPESWTLLRLARPLRVGARLLAGRLARERAQAVGLAFAGNEPLTKESCAAVKSELAAVGIGITVEQPFFAAFSAADDRLRWNWDSGLASGSPTEPSLVDSRATFGRTSDSQLLTQAVQLMHDRGVDHVVVCGFRNDAAQVLRDFAVKNRPLASITAFPAALQLEFAPLAGFMADWTMSLGVFHPGLRWADPVLNRTVGASGQRQLQSASAVSFAVQAAAAALAGCSVRQPAVDAIFVPLENRSALAASTALLCPSANAVPPNSGVSALLLAARRIRAETAAGPVELDGGGLNVAPDAPPFVLQLQPSDFVSTGVSVALPGTLPVVDRVVLPDAMAARMTPPAALVIPVPGSNFVSTSSAVGIAVVATSALSAVALVFAGLAMLWWRDGDTVKAARLIPTLIITMGLILLAVWPAQMVGIPTQPQCAAKSWVLGLGSLLCLLPFIAKTWYRWQAVVEPLVPDRQEGITGCKLIRWFVVFGSMELGVLLLESSGPPLALRGACVRADAWSKTGVWISTAWHLLLWMWLVRLLVIAAFVPDPAKESSAAAALAVTGAIVGGVGIVSEAAHQAGTARFDAATAAIVACVGSCVVVWATAFRLFAPKVSSILQESERNARLAKIAPRDEQDDLRDTQQLRAGGADHPDATEPTPVISPAQQRMNEVAAKRRLFKAGLDEAPPSDGQTLADKPTGAGRSRTRDTGTGRTGTHAEVHNLKEDVERLRGELAIARGQIEVLRAPLRDELAAQSRAGGSLSDAQRLDQVRKSVPRALAYKLQANDTSAAEQRGAALRAAELAAAPHEADAAAPGPALEPWRGEDASTEAGMSAVRHRVVRSVRRHERVLDGARTVLERTVGPADEDETAVLWRFGTLGAAAAWLAAAPEDPGKVRARAVDEARHRAELRNRAKAEALADTAPMSLAAIDAAVRFARLRADMAHDDGLSLPGAADPGGTTGPGGAEYAPERRRGAAARRKPRGVMSSRVRDAMARAQAQASRDAMLSVTADGAITVDGAASLTRTPGVSRPMTPAGRRVVVVAGPGTAGRAAPRAPGHWAAVTAAATSAPPSYDTGRAKQPEPEPDPDALPEYDDGDDATTTSSSSGGAGGTPAPHGRRIGAPGALA